MDIVAGPQLFQVWKRCSIPVRRADSGAGTRVGVAVLSAVAVASGVGLTCTSVAVPCDPPSETRGLKVGGGVGVAGDDCCGSASSVDSETGCRSALASAWNTDVGRTST